ncbi:MULTISPECIES: hypothetical protein [Komagataeibacter]|uniref:Uncharacterized protein n=2 Tax=Komagataeibacter TaxID=1434011 RepID=A0A0D6QA35_KOMXY|nr:MULTISPECIES: hypothetical protein [Komagataeibacter]MBL7231976.1 hypothetical protein [Komagataeibacter oboediens]MBT0675392.1 hypothetical protein [Komagataeibacter oboediens]MBT0678915.1 hypothetical protein [Komagataeibacter oboediens]MBV0887499.1 hypothetical protein [Komagataeibacter oboediens]MBV1823842.1 hypothetical protein [Komagataeibacter oboediens]
MPKKESARSGLCLPVISAACVVACLATAPAHADNERFEGSDLTRDAPQYFVLRPQDSQTASTLGELRLSESGIDFTNGELLEVSLEQGSDSHLIYRVEPGQNPVLPSGRRLCPPPLNPIYLDFASQQDGADGYRMTLYCGSRSVPFRAISPDRAAAVFSYRRAADALWAHSATEGGYLHGAVAQYCAVHHDSAGVNACTTREEAAYATIMGRRIAPPVLKQCAAYVTGLHDHAGYVSFVGLLNCTRVRDSRALFDYCSQRITGQKREDDTRFLDGNPAQAQGVALCFNALAAHQARD